MNNSLFLLASINDNDRKLIVILLVIIIILFILLALIGMAIRALNSFFQKKMDRELHDVCVYRVIKTPEQLKKYGQKKNVRLWFKEASIPLLLSLITLLFYLIYSGVTGLWTLNHFERFGSLLYQWDWGNPDNFANFFGLTLLAQWPPLINTPHWVNEYWASYILIPLFIISLIYYLITAQAFIVRELQINKRMKTVFKKTLEGFNYYDDLKTEAKQGEIKKANRNLDNNEQKTQ